MANPARDALQHYAAGNLALAERSARAALLQAPGNADAINLLAVICCRRGDLDRGVAWALLVLGQSPENVQALELLGDALHSRRDYAGAAQAFGRAAAAGAGASGRLHAKRAYALHAAGDLSEAVTSYVAAVACSSIDPGLNVDMGRALARLGRLAEAADAFRRAVAADPELALAWLYLGEVLGRIGELE